MIVERLVFNAKFGQGDGVAQAFKDFRDTLSPRVGAPVPRIMVDAAGPMFTTVVESDYRDMAHVAQVQSQLQGFYADPEFQQWFARWSGLVETGTRELYQVVD